MHDFATGFLNSKKLSGANSHKVFPRSGLTNEVSDDGLTY